MKISTCICTLLGVGLISTSLLIAQQKTDNSPIPLAHENSDIPTDSAVTWGLLDNGLRYAILPNVEPPERISLRLYVEAGSLMENDDQQGLAHFLEHMAFNGTTNFPPGSMVEYFQRLGMGFGNHTNAHTSFNETVYKLELPGNSDDLLDEAFKLLRDYADGMLLTDKEIDSERGIIISEKRSRDSVRWRTFVEQMKFAFPDHKISRRMPIGTQEVIEEAKRDRFVDFYSDWYTPNRMVLVAVGDTTVEKIESYVDKYFKNLPAREKKADPELGKLSNRGFATHHHFEEEAGETSISIETLRERISPPDNQARRAEDLKLTLATRMLSRRLERIAKDPASAISSSTTHAGDFFDLGFAQYGSIDADCKPSDWEKALATVEQELRRVLEHGFTTSELTEIKATLLNSYENAAEQMDTRKSQSLASSIVSHIGSRRIFTNPKEDLPRVQTLLESISADDCQTAMKALWADDAERLVILSGNAKVEDADAKIKTAYDSSQAVPVDAPEDRGIAKFAYSELPEAGVIAAQKEVEDPEVTQITFANNIRVNLKVTDFEDETVWVTARFGGGRLTEPKDKPGLSMFTQATFQDGGLDAHSEDDLKQIYAGKSVLMQFKVEDDAFILAGRSNDEDLNDQLQLMRAYLTNPGYRSESVIEFQRSLDHLYQQLDRTAEGVSAAEGARFLRSGDTRFGYPTREVIGSRTLDESKNWLTPQLETAYLELTIVGDFDKQATIERIAGTFGNLPERQASKPSYEEERKVTFPAGQRADLTFDSDIQKAVVSIYWPTEDMFDIQRTRRLGILGAVIDDRLRKKVREELGDSYSPFAHNIPSDTFTDYGYIMTMVGVDPSQVEAVTQVVSQIGEELSTGDAITQDELERAKKPNIVSIEDMRRTNRYWMGSVLESSQEYPQRLAWSRSFVDDYKSITLEEVNALAKTYLDNGKMAVVTVKPAKEPAE
ncbi:MAG: insulinase family protein [Verrucomicrobiota bacterium]